MFETDDVESASEPMTRARTISALATARADLLEAVTGLTPREAEKAMGPGRWNVRETVLHVVARDQARLREMEAVIAGADPSWRHFGNDEIARLNAQEVGALRINSWDHALGLLDATRREVQERLATVPEQPLAVWQLTHPFGAMMDELSRHDRHHAQAVRRWRTATGI